MAIIHDYLCKACGAVFEDVLGTPEPCACGHSELTITFQKWTKLTAMNRGRSWDDLVDGKGFRSAFKASEDPVCAYELGTIRDGAGIRTFSDEQSKHFASKVLRDGDTPQLRKEILAERNKNLGKDA